MTRSVPFQLLVRFTSRGSFIIGSSLPVTTPSAEAEPPARELNSKGIHPQKRVMKDNLLTFFNHHAMYFIAKLTTETSRQIDERDDSPREILLLEARHCLDQLLTSKSRLEQRRTTATVTANKQSLKIQKNERFCNMVKKAICDLLTCFPFFIAGHRLTRSC